MHAAHQRRAPYSTGSGKGQAFANPRVVILNAGQQARVEMLDLPDTTAVGGSFEHCGRTWRVTGLRTSSRVFIAEPEK